ncbi:MAG TPA: YqgE/AlgH family protein [Vicinamibacterales bacterium]|nr:YqgE/AlgH family protein [Vicinamibacterales bacterium]
MTDGFRPTLLLSMPQMQDPNFARTVVLLCDYLPEGAFGLVLNRPTDLPASEMVKLEPPVVPGNQLPLFIGGPVQPERGWILVGDLPEEPEFRTVVEGLYLSTSPQLLRRVLETPVHPRARVVAGYAGWGPGQLDEELAQSAWLMADVQVDLVFDVDAHAMWETAIRRLGADPSMLQTSPGIH